MLVNHYLCYTSHKYSRVRAAEGELLRYRRKVLNLRDEVEGWEKQRYGPEYAETLTNLARSRGCLNPVSGHVSPLPFTAAGIQYRPPCAQVLRFQSPQELLVVTYTMYQTPHRRYALTNMRALATDNRGATHAPSSGPRLSIFAQLLADKSSFH